MTRTPPYFVMLIFESRCRLCPIFLVSSVTGENLDLLKMFLNLLSTRISYNNEDPAEFQIDDIYTVPVKMATLVIMIDF